MLLAFPVILDARTYVQRIYAVRKAELCLSNINTILASENMKLQTIHSDSKITVNLKANSGYGLSYDIHIF